MNIGNMIAVIIIGFVAIVTQDGYTHMSLTFISNMLVYQLVTQKE